MNVLLCLSHSIEEYDQLRLLHSLGYGVASIGGYIDPAHPHDDKRPPLPDIPEVPEVRAAVDGQGVPDNLGAAQAHIPDAILEWLGDDGVVIYHHHLHRMFGQWRHLRDWQKGSPRRRLVWRTVGQSVGSNEAEARPFRSDGLEVVRYSPKEAAIPGYVGSDALIRFYKDPDEWSGWTGEGGFVGNVTQDLPGRDPWCNPGFYREATEGLDARPAGRNSDQLPGGIGEITYEEMRTYLQSARAYMYTGTQPASYTLGLIEAMMTGVPVVSLTPRWFGIFPEGPYLFEGHELAPLAFERPEDAQSALRDLQTDPDYAARVSGMSRARAIAYFDRDRIAEQWRAFLG